MLNFSKSERRILSYFRYGSKIFYKGRNLEVREAGKPTSQQGEPKTDIYVLAVDGLGSEEIKISYKKENADFLENKTNAERAEQLFGPDWRQVIRQSTTSIQEKFEKRMLVYKKKYGRTEKGAITLGWKFELMNKPSGDLSGNMALTKEQIYDVYAGCNLSVDKRNATVNGRIIRNSGVAEYILMSDRANSAQDVIDQMISIEKYVEAYPKIYFACKALNYRTFAGKYDGNRPLAVQVDWSIKSGKLVSKLIFDKPLEMNGDEMAKRLLRCMKDLGIKTTDDIDLHNVDINNER
ncbi:MAG: hypothetical protein HFG92_04790 [Dorea sp.]|nr:hypothetical protein [Dorea sp.]